ncbi:hypothetical protein ISG33_14215 [Glaciecola sp. MH2013]|uniref:hypothetical protein n=1 Tax=Glaciecola sp. MH2013 TaxID=2785524 RepID=UPI00189C8589|nr:hypothetical protein [Glaciecola sp. MH2013]MBF7074556.1 hypothetical protein [Glaciecola sp. MH2013]
MYLFNNESKRPLVIKTAKQSAKCASLNDRSQSSSVLAKLKVACITVPLLLLCGAANAGSLEQAKRMHDRLAGVPGSTEVIQQMADLIDAGNARAAAEIAMDSPSFYNVTIKNWVTPWTNEEFDVFAPLNDYTATVIGMVRDEVDFRQILTGDIIYVAESGAGVPAYNNNNNAHYEALENQGADLSSVLVASTQSSVTGIPADATAGVMTTRAAAKSFFKDGTNRAMFRFTLMNHMCADLEAFKDASLPPDRIRQDLSRSPGGDSRIFTNSCAGCHSGMDPLAQAFAYYNYEYNVEGDPEGQNGSLVYNAEGQVDPETNLRVQAKYWINSNNFPFGYVTMNDTWDNYWREGQNQTIGWSPDLPGTGSGAKSMGEELANTQTFAKCQVTKVFENVCLRSPQDQTDRDTISSIQAEFVGSNYNIKNVFAATADYCKGE